MSIASFGAELHVWTVHLAALKRQPAACASLWSTLNAEETTRARRMRRMVDQEYAALSRGVLRTLLGRYTSSGPATLQFVYGTHGKPALQDMHENLPAFNVSHSGDWLLIAVAPAGSAVGIDLEMHRPMTDWKDIAQKHFHPEEFSTLIQLEQADQQKSFFDVWTRKEAVAKALGLGLSLDLSSFDVPVGNLDKVTPVLGLTLTDAGTVELMPMGVQIPDGYSAALACYRSTAPLRVVPLTYQSGDS